MRQACLKGLRLGEPTAGRIFHTLQKFHPPSKAEAPPQSSNPKTFFLEIGPILCHAGLKGCLGLGEPTAGCSFHKLQGFHPPCQAEAPQSSRPINNLFLRKRTDFVPSMFEGFEAWRPLLDLLVHHAKQKPRQS